MHHLETLRESILQLLRNYPIDSYYRDVPPSVTLRRYIMEIEFLKNENNNIRKLGMAAMEGYSITLDEVQKVINDAIKAHFRLD